MRAGGFDRKITIQQRSVTRGAAGGEIETWTTFATVWATRNDQRGREYYAAQREVGEAVTQFVIRYLSGLKKQMRIVDEEGLVYDISDFSQIGRRIGMSIYAHAVQA